MTDETNNEFTASDMATAAAQGFRDGQKVALAGATNNASGPDNLRARFDEIEREIMDGKHDAESVFTQMRTAALYTAPPAAAVVMPERKNLDEPTLTQAGRRRYEGWNAALDVVARLNPAPTVGQGEQPIRMPTNELKSVLAEAEGVRDLSDVAHGWYEATECIARLNPAPTQKPGACQNCGATTGEACNLIGCFGLENPAPDHLRDATKMVPEGWHEFIAGCAETAGAMVNGNRLSALARELLAAAPTPEPASPWISVEARLPELDTPVWLYDEDVGTFFGMRESSTDGWMWVEGLGLDLMPAGPGFSDIRLTDSEPTLWMPLPSAPEQPAKEVK